MKYAIITDSDLDGAVCYLVTKWFHPEDYIEVYPTTVTKFRSEYIKILSKTNLDNYDKVFILDLDVGEHKDLIDKKNHFIIDHHKTHTVAAQYKNATAIVKEYTSACKMVYKTFNTLYNKDITDEQKKLIIIADDYDSYTLSLSESKKLNIVYWNSDNRFEAFCKTFNKGFFGFNIKQENIIRLYTDELEKIKKSLKIYHTSTSIKDTPTKIFAAFANTAINDVCDILLNDYDADVAIVLNLDTKKASFRRSKKCTHINLIDIVKKLCNNEGGGHECAAGGVINDTFLEFTKLLKPYGNG